MKPKFLSLSDRKFKNKIKDGYHELRNCRICPRECGVNRIKGEKGFCKSDWKLKIASYNLHFGEEPPLSGHRGSGTIFFSNCNLQCMYCQNYSISQLGVGEIYTIPQLARMMLKLQEKGAHNINFVTPNHFVPQICAGIFKAKEHGLEIPIVYNTSGYDSMRSLELIDGIVDIFLVDMRYSDPRWSKRYSAAEDYVTVNRAALKEMHRQVGNLVLKHGIAQRGIIVRHLVMPENVSGSGDIFRFLSSEVSRKTYISLMDQYFPCFKVLNDDVISRRITAEEYEKARELMASFNLERGWIQEHLI